MAPTNLTSAVLELAAGDQSLTENAQLLILGALDSDQALQDALGGKGRSIAETVAVQREARAPIGAYLKSVKVAGFRGVGVTRDVGSVVTISESSHPATRYLDDGLALALDEGVPSDVKDRVIPGLCRMALESAAYEIYEARMISGGGSAQEVEDKWLGATTVRQRLALALHGDKSASVAKWLGTGQRLAGSNVCNRGVHVGSTADHADEVRAVRIAIKDLRAAK